MFYIGKKGMAMQTLTDRKNAIMDRVWREDDRQKIMHKVKLCIIYFNSFKCTQFPAMHFKIISKSDFGVRFRIM